MTVPDLMSPAKAGFVRAAQFDRLLKAPGEVWRTPEGVLLVLPLGCDCVGLIRLSGARGETLACVEPAGVYSIWPHAGALRGGDYLR